MLDQKDNVEKNAKKKKNLINKIKKKKKNKNKLKIVRNLEQAVVSGRKYKQLEVEMGARGEVQCTDNGCGGGSVFSLINNYLWLPGLDGFAWLAS